MFPLGKNTRYLALSIAAGIILSIPWYNFGSGVALLFGFIPLLYLVDSISKDQERVRFRIMLFPGITVFIWAVLSGWWLKNATFGGTVFLVIATTVFYTTIVLLFHSVKKKFGRIAGYVSLVSFWVAFEYWYLNAELSVPWLNLGNGLSHNIRSIQWFEYTGCLGGTVWVLVLNILLYEILIRLLSKHVNKGLIISYVLILLTPVIFSQLRFRNYEETGEKINVLSIQPNIDPYEKFVSYTAEEQVNILLELSSPHLDEDLDYIITPETAITDYSDIDRLGTDPLLDKFRQLVKDYPNLNVILGMTLSKMYDRNEPVSKTACLNNSGYYYDTYNSAVQINHCSIQIYHKSRLFPAVETMPYSNSLKFLRNLMIKLGGTFRSHGTSPDRINLVSCNDSLHVAPVICWENIYGEFVTGFIKNGATVIFNITNEGWWGDTPGYKMFKKYAQVRAIETRRSVVRSANTGISAIINQKGEILDQLNWDIRGTVKGSVSLNDSQTFYTRHGDYIGEICRIPALAFLLALAIHSMVGLVRKTA